MIKHINSASPWIRVESGGYPSIYPSNQNAGTVRFNTSTNSLETWDGATWVGIGNAYASIEPSSQMQEVLEWAMERMLMDRRIQDLIETNPTVADAHATYVKAAEQLAVVAKLVQT